MLEASSSVQREVAMSQFLFSDDEMPALPAEAAGGDRQESIGVPRLRVPQRHQVEMQWRSLDELLEPDHQARVVLAAVERLDLSRWLREIRAVEGHVGRDATSPQLLVALWVYATLDAVSSARELAKLCGKHLAYQWLCGGVSVNYRLLAMFRSRHGDRWDALLTQIVGALLAEDLVTMQCVAQDGMKVRAHAGKSSFRRVGKLEECLEKARQQVETLRQQANAEDQDAIRKAKLAARQRVAEDRQRRLDEALRNCELLQRQREESAKKSGRNVKEARASITDPEARVMQFSDNGFRPAYNVQLATDVGSGVIVGVTVTNAGNDLEQLPPMLKQIEERYGMHPTEALVDGGFASHHAIEEATANGTTVYAPLKDEAKQLAKGKDPYATKPGDKPALKAWRARMKDAASKAKYRLRCQTAEWVNAIFRNRGMQQMPVRGQVKCQAVATLYAITHNLMLAGQLRAKAAQSG
jgi:transposase